jgi:hypothetical protein
MPSKAGMMAEAVNVVIIAWVNVYVSRASIGDYALASAYMESDTRQVDNLLPLRPVVRISRIRRWKRVKIDSAMSLDQVVAMFFGKDGQSIVQFDRCRRQRCVLDIVVLLLLLRSRGVLRCDFVVHGLQI